MKKLLLALLALFAIGVQAGETITGAGATFPAPVYAKWAEQYQKQTGIKLNYQAIGSGGGINQIDNKTVDFGATDDPRKAADLNKHNQAQFATVKGAVVAVVNITGVKSNQINLSARQLADVFDGKYNTWNELDAKLPSTEITRVVRADASGTTAVFTNYLSKNGSSTKPGKSVQWQGKNITAGKGNAGVAAMVKRVPGSIGYIEHAYAKQGGLVTTRLNGVEANFDNFVNGQYKLTAPTYIIFYKQGANKEAIKFWQWALANGDKLAISLNYVPLNAKEKTESVGILKSLE